MLLLSNAALDLTVCDPQFVRIFANRPSCYPARGGSSSGGNYWGNYISVRKVRLLSNTQNVIFGDLCFIRFTKMPLCFNLDCRIWSLLTLLSKKNTVNCQNIHLSNHLISNGLNNNSGLFRFSLYSYLLEFYYWWWLYLLTAHPMSVLCTQGLL